MGVSSYQRASANNLFGSEDRFQKKSISILEASILDFLVAMLDQISGP